MAIVTSPTNPVRATGLQESKSWQQAMKMAIRDPGELCRILALPSRYESVARPAAQSFSVFAPRDFVSKMRVGDPHDPLLRQVLPLDDELREITGFTTDPVNDHAATLAPGLIQKYHGRALLITTGACAVHCRYCFRRHFPYEHSPRSVEDFGPVLDRISADPTIEEVLLSGGDPLTLVDSHLAELAAGIAAMPHVRRLRIHTRLPVMIPQRVTDELLGWLSGTRLTAVVVIHANHPAELDGPVAKALDRLVESGIPLLNQAVLLRGVNDDAAVLEQLCRRLVDLRVMPYYLHQLDRATGTMHFEVPVERGRELIEQLRARVPGYAVPRYVQEVAGEAAKRVLA